MESPQKSLDVSLRDLELFVDLAQARSLRELSRRQKLGASQISKRIAKLERSVGQGLFKRSVNGLSLSSEGVRFWKTAQKILEAGRELRSSSPGIPTQAGPVYGVAASSYLNHHLLPEALATVRKPTGGERFQLLEIATDEIVARAIKGQFEIAVYLGKREWPKSWAARRIGTLPSGLFARAGHVLSSGASELEVSRFRFVIPLHHSQGKITWGDDGCPLPVERRLAGDSVSTADAALEWVRVTDQLAYLPRIVARRALQNREVIEIAVPEWKGRDPELFVAVRTDQIRSRMFASIVHELEKRI